MFTRCLLLFLLALYSFQFSTAQSANEPDTCCFSFQTQPIPVKVITAYAVTDLRCTKPGVIFTLQDGRRVCADPQVKWVKNNMNNIEQRLFNNPTKPTDN
ncbi:C-C motif chemokine 3-like [Tachysurus fulvidraco]|uniref:C-C motif chemokine 3-like n=1 Tax=Tachysurus fulvidraco TaxID=1234273 RepID=UPI000F4D66BD|nr:C-C motif chemokine 3-like [Tachysurus fulvidraco]